MLLWQHKNRLKSFFCLQLIGFVIALHMIVLICVFVQSNVDYDELHVIASVSYDLGTDVVVVPFKKVVEQPEVQEPATLPTIKETTVVEMPKAKPIKKIVPKPEVKKEVPTKEISKPEQPIKEPKVVEKKEEQKVQISENKEVETSPQKVDAVTKDVAKQDMSEKITPEKVAPEKVAPEKVVPKQVSSKQVSPKVQKQISTKELRALNIQQAIAQQVNMHWQPPEGFADNTQATVEITLTYKGEIGAIDMKESSGVLAFDIHARSALYAMRFPRACWGKKITITFS